MFVAAGISAATISSASPIQFVEHPDAIIVMLNTTANATMQLSSAPAMRGRVMAIFLAIALGGTPIGAPFVGWVADTFGPRWSLGVGAASGILAALVCVNYLVKHRRLRVWIEGARLRFSIERGESNTQRSP